MFGKELFIRLSVRVFRVRLSNFVCPSFPFGIEGGMWVVIVLIPDHCHSIYFIRMFCGKWYEELGSTWPCFTIFRSLFRF